MVLSSAVAAESVTIPFVLTKRRGARSLGGVLHYLRFSGSPTVRSSLQWYYWLSLPSSFSKKHTQVGLLLLLLLLLHLWRAEHLHTVYYTTAAEAASSSVYDSLAANKSSSQRLLIFGICQQLRFWVQKPAAATAELSKTKLLLGPPYPINSNCVIGCLFGKRAVVERTLFQKSSSRAIFSQEKKIPSSSSATSLVSQGTKRQACSSSHFLQILGRQWIAEHQDH